jgi:cell division protease FtsH
VRSIVSTGYTKARNILETYRDALERVARALLDREVLDAIELKLLIDNKPLPEKPPPPPPSAPPVTTKEPQFTLRPEPRPIPGMAKGEKPAPA